jgi:pilus assembly protein Flp/PilA
MWMIARKVLNDQSAATAIEYGLMIGVIGTALVLSMGTITNELGDLYVLINNKTTNAASKL